MRGLVSTLLVLAASVPALAQPSVTPPVAGEPPVVVVAPAQPRQAHGVYLAYSLGGLDIHDDLARHMDGAVRLRAAIGYRHRQLAFELWGAAAIGWHDSHPYGTQDSYLSLTPDSIGPSSPSGTGKHHGHTNGMAMVGLDVKYIKSLTRHLEVYARGGLSRAVVEGLGSGRGLGIGGGAQLKGKVPALGFLFWPLFFTGLGPKVTAAVYVESGYEFYRLHSSARTTDAQLTSWTFGLAVGSDF